MERGFIYASVRGERIDQYNKCCIQLCRGTVLPPKTREFDLYSPIVITERSEKSDKNIHNFDLSGKIDQNCTNFVFQVASYFEKKSIKLIFSTN